MSASSSRNSSPPGRASRSVVRVASLQAGGDGGDDLVAADVAERVVDELEGVDVEVQERDAGAGAAGAGERQREVLLEQGAVRQAGQRVAEGELRPRSRSASSARWSCGSASAQRRAPAVSCSPTCPIIGAQVGLNVSQAARSTTTSRTPWSSRHVRSGRRRGQKAPDRAVLPGDEGREAVDARPRGGVDEGADERGAEAVALEGSPTTIAHSAVSGRSVRGRSARRRRARRWRRASRRARCG